MSGMSVQFEEVFDQMASRDWLSWLGQPLLYDGALCVTRSKEELDERNKHMNAKLCLTS